LQPPTALSDALQRSSESVVISTKRVLVIAYFFPPLANSGTQRPLKFVKYLPQFGWTPTVLTVDTPPDKAVDDSLMGDIPPGVQVVRVPMLSEQIGTIAGSLACGILDRLKISEAVSWRMRSIWKEPDLYALWLPSARRAGLRLMRGTSYDAIIATGFPWTSLLLGRDLSRRTGRPFIADFRDPWSADDVFRTASTAPKRDRELAMERSVVKQASVVLSVSENMAQVMRDIHQTENKAKFVTITNGYDPDDSAKREQKPAPKAGTFRLVFTGVWRPGYGPDALYDAIEHLSKTNPSAISNLEVIAVGFPPGEGARRGLSKYICEFGRVSHNDALGWIETADALFLSIAGGAFQQLALPGKLFEYIASARPVIAMTNPDSEAARLLEDVGGGLVIRPGDLDRLTSTLIVACAGRLQVPPRNPKALTKYERRNLTEQLAMVLNRAMVTSAPDRVQV
jgi:glycosyltransferase involved in cell wall biosynthesis